MSYSPSAEHSDHTVIVIERKDPPKQRRFIVLAVEAFLNEEDIFSDVVASALQQYVDEITAGISGNDGIEDRLYNEDMVRVKTLAVSGDAGIDRFKTGT